MDFGTIILIGIIVVAGLMLLPRLMNNTTTTTRRGPERPRYKDPDVRTQGAIGRPSHEDPRYNDPDIRGQGAFGSDAAGAESPDRPHYESSDAAAKSGFGRRAQPKFPGTMTSNEEDLMREERKRIREDSGLDTHTPENDDEITSRGSFGRDKGDPS